MEQLLANNELILMEAAIIEQLRRSSDVHLHQSLVNAQLIYDKNGRQALSRIYGDYIDIALNAELPFLLCTPTWRANKSRVYEANVSREINIDASRFMRRIRDSKIRGKSLIKIGGMVGCKNDCYRPDEGLSVSESEQFHSWQIDQLARSDVDFLIAETLPSTEEALGIAKAMESTGLPYIISFVISRSGEVLDGTSLIEAVHRIDSSTDKKPLGYMVNCAYPTFLRAPQQPQALFSRLIGYQANASSLDHCDLDNAEFLEAENVPDWGEAMLSLNRSYGVKILGGCCGTGNDHLRYIASASSSTTSSSAHSALVNLS